MKGFLEFMWKLAIVALIAYGVFLIYQKFIKKQDEVETVEDLDDLEDKCGCGCSEMTFGERVKAAADKHLQRIK